jgi:phage FluMu protein Com
MKIIRCEVCCGRKVINGLGGMEKKCHECKGVGHVEHIEDEIEYLKKSDVVTDRTEQDTKLAVPSNAFALIFPSEVKKDVPKNKPGRRPRLENGKK